MNLKTGAVTVVGLLVVLFAAAMVLAEDLCPPKYCEEIKVSCLTCNGTMVFLNVPNCGCCPQCVPYRGEGEACDNDEELLLTDNKKASSMEEPAAKVDESGKKENQDKEKKAPIICSPQLTCLQGTCVVIF